MASKSRILTLYRSMLRESRKFDNYNYRNYSLRRIKDAFRENKNIIETERIAAFVKEAEESLEMIKRQVSIGQIYSAPDTVIEHLK